MNQFLKKHLSRLRFRLSLLRPGKFGWYVVYHNRVQTILVLAWSSQQAIEKATTWRAYLRDRDGVAVGRNPEWTAQFAYDCSGGKQVREACPKALRYLVWSARPNMPRNPKWAGYESEWVD